jgi:hypothetical protein
MTLAGVLILGAAEVHGTTVQVQVHAGVGYQGLSKGVQLALVPDASFA